MKKILLIFSFLTLLTTFSFWLFNSVNDKGNYVQLCSNTSEELLSTNQTRGAFNGNATTLNLNIQNGNAFLYQGQKLYFRFDSTERQFIKLNYSGYSAKLKVFNYNYFNSNDFLFYSSNISNDVDIIFCEPSQTYIFEFESIMHITYNILSTFGYRYHVEYFDVSLSSYNNTSSYCNNMGYYATYLNAINDNLNFNIINDSRVLITDTRAPEYSAVAYNYNSVSAYILGGNTFYTTSGIGSATFIDETTVLSAAHSFYALLKSNNSWVLLI